MRPLEASTRPGRIAAVAAGYPRAPKRRSRSAGNMARFGAGQRGADAPQCSASTMLPAARSDQPRGSRRRAPGRINAQRASGMRHTTPLATPSTRKGTGTTAARHTLHAFQCLPSCTEPNDVLAVAAGRMIAASPRMPSPRRGSIPGAGSPVVACPTAQPAAPPAPSHENAFNATSAPVPSCCRAGGVWLRRAHARSSGRGRRRPSRSGRHRGRRPATAVHCPRRCVCFRCGLRP